MRARMALAVSGQTCELREVVLRNKPQGLLQASPKATVPVLVLPNGQVLEQSLDIMRWALAQHDPDGWLAPSQGSVDEMLDFIAACDGPFKHALDRCKYPDRYPDADSRAEKNKAAAWLETLESRLSVQPFLFGAHAALADMAVAPFVRQFAGIDAAWWDAQPWPRLQAWLAQWQASRLFGLVMCKLPAWVDGTPGVAFPQTEAALAQEPRAGHPF
jgi:glutathione S-transferase